jgi:hypothetical protein
VVPAVAVPGIGVGCLAVCRPARRSSAFEEVTGMHSSLKKIRVKA